MLEPDRIDHLLELARHGALGREEQILGELLGDGRAALDHGARFEIAEGRAHEPERIDAEMLVEAAVLGGEHGLGEVRRQMLEPHMAAAQAPLGEHGAVGGENGEVGRPVVERHQHGIGQLGDEIGADRADDERGPHRHEQKEAQDGVLGALARGGLAPHLRAPVAGHAAPAAPPAGSFRSAAQP